MRSIETIPRSRLDALTDGVFAFAMTLLALDLRLPEHFGPHNSAELLAAVADLWQQWMSYAISFLVLALRWIALSRFATAHESVTYRFAIWWMLHLFLITSIPFTTMLIGRYNNLPAASWLYAANMAAAALVVLRFSTMDDSKRGPERQYYILSLLLILLSAAVSVGVSLLSVPYAMLPYVINAGAPMLKRWTDKAEGRAH